MKSEWLKGSGYVFGAFVLFPLLLIIANVVFFRGNGVKNNDIEDYISNSNIDTVSIPQDKKYEYKQYHVKLVKGRGGVFIETYIFYSSKYRKYLNLILFDCFEKDCLSPDRRHYVLLGFATITARINQHQLNDPAYGTQENPVPIFAKDLLDADDYGSQDKEFFHVSDIVNRIFVGQYLNRFMPKEEFKKMFRSGK